MDDVAAWEYYEQSEIVGAARQSTARLWYFWFVEFRREIGDRWNAIFVRCT